MASMPPGRMEEALVQLLAGFMNEHAFNCYGWDHEIPVEEWDKKACEGCCPVCCAPCSAAAWLRDNADEWLTKALNVWWPGADWVWQRPDGGVDWAKVEWHWRNLEPRLCHDDEYVSGG